MILNKQLIEFFKWGDAFLQRSQLRSLRNLAILPRNTETTTIVELMQNDKSPLHESSINILYSWADCCRWRGKYGHLRNQGVRYTNQKEYLNANATEKEDPFAGCYFYDGTVSEKGIRLRMEAGIR